MTDHELEALLRSLESDRVERKASFSENNDRIREAVCAFANDLPNHENCGVVFIGVHDDLRCANLEISDCLLLSLVAMKSDGNITPFPSLTVEKRHLNGCELAVVIVEPAEAPPVRFKGRVYVRVGPSRAIASPDDERRLSEKRRFRDLPFDIHPVSSASLEDLDLESFKNIYLASSVAPDVLEENQRTVLQQLTSLRFTDGNGTPTVLGILVVGRDPAEWIGGAYVQFLRIDGTSLTDPIKDADDIVGPLPQLINSLLEKLRVNISTGVDPKLVPEVRTPDYPIVALQQLALNAILHRSYENTNAPIRITWFSDRIEIQNPGGPFGQVTIANFGQPGVTDYRNRHVAEALKNLGYVQKFGVGIQIARQELKKNGNSELELTPSDSYVLATIRTRL